MSKFAKFMFVAAIVIAGKWDMVVDTPHGSMPFTLSIEEKQGSVTGTLSSEHTGNMQIEGSFEKGALSFITKGEHPLRSDANLQADGSLAGEMEGAMGKMKWTAKRATK